MAIDDDVALDPLVEQGLEKPPEQLLPRVPIGLVRLLSTSRAFMDKMKLSAAWASMLSESITRTSWEPQVEIGPRSSLALFATDHESRSLTARVHTVADLGTSFPPRFRIGSVRVSYLIRDIASGPYGDFAEVRMFLTMSIPLSRSRNRKLYPAEAREHRGPGLPGPVRADEEHLRRRRRLVLGEVRH